MRLIDADKGLISKIQRETSCNFITAQKIVDSMTLVEAIVIPDNATNGDMIKAMFPESDGYEYAVEKDLEIITLFVIKGLQVFYVNFDMNWWNAPYKGV